MEVYRTAQSVKSLSKRLIWVIYSKSWGWWVQSPWVPRVLNLWSYFVVGQCLMRVEFEDNCSLKVYLSNTNVPSKVIWVEDYLSLEMNHKEYLNLKKVRARYFFNKFLTLNKTAQLLSFLFFVLLFFSSETSRTWGKKLRKEWGTQHLWERFCREVTMVKKKILYISGKHSSPVLHVLGQEFPN